jgi:predicted 2-oxoglutarate/Fe(II)-dependent dioxygenase YbiX/peroxiredoxin
MLTAPKEALAAGDRAPNFILPDHTGTVRMFYERVQGRPTVLLFVGKLQPPLLPAAFSAFEAKADDLAAASIDVFTITVAAPEAVRAFSPKTALWADPEGKITAAFLQQMGVDEKSVVQNGEAVAAFLDPNQRLQKTVSAQEGDLAEAALAFFAARPAVPPAQVRSATAPVLIIPDLLDPDMCQQLMAMFDVGSVAEATVGSVIAGKETERLAPDFKKRLDLKIDDREMHNTLQNVIGRRVVPELAKAHNFQGFKFDQFLVCRYAADRADKFAKHRDNISPETADRRFAMTLNLNGDEYEGGELVFPEYGPDKYKPGNGGAVIFSCSLLHEALPVTKGVRFALLTFLRQPQQAQQGGPKR